MQRSQSIAEEANSVHRKTNYVVSGFSKSYFNSLFYWEICCNPFSI